MATFLRCFLAPRLYHVFQKGLNPGSDYIPNVVEKFSDYVVKWFRFCWSFSYYTSPVLLVIFYRRGAFTPEGGLSALSYGTSLSVILFVALWARAIGRRTNKQYVEFLQTLGEAKQVMSHDNKVKLSQYDFDFFAWPVEFTAVNDERRRLQVSHEPRRKGVVDKVKAIPCHILSYMAAHSFGMRMVYPGSTAVLQALVAPMLSIIPSLMITWISRGPIDITNGSDYIPNVVEKFSDYVVKWFRFCWSFSYYTSPVLLVIFYRRGAFTPEGGLSALSYGTSLSVILFVALWARAIGRRTNKQYVEFLQTLGEAKQVMSHDNKVKLSQYDFDFFAWPVEFTAVNDERRRLQVSHEPRRKGVVDKVKAIPCHILSYMAAHSFGMRMVYPGSTAVLQALVAPMLIQGRTKLVEEKNGTRFKLRTVDQNEIDVMFVDRRNDPLHPNGDTLVICCEGNAGFYEIGIMVTALDAGYSVIGWNHPGFYGSSGSPYPDQEQNAADAVMQFCTHKLGFPLYDITVFGWSIGGYPVTWLAMNYPEIKSVVIDASFDDILPLADAKMPPSWKTLVKLTIRKYLNLNIAEQLTKYPGPVLLIRRARDEIITTIGPTFRTSNRGNFILTKLIAFRYPKIAEGTFGVLTQWLATDSAGQSALLLEHEVDESWCESVLSSYIEEHSKSYPMFVGEDLPLESRKQLALFLATKYMEEFDATHCQPLPSQNLHQPWSEQM